MAKDLKGHFEPDDPRHVLWGAGNCDWPTVPPYRMLIGNPIIHPLWIPLLNGGILCEPYGEPTHDSVVWANINPISAWIERAWVWRQYNRALQETFWSVQFDVIFWPEAVQVTGTRGPGPGNVDVILDNSDWQHPTHISPGPWIGLWQVYFNETEYLDGWPPWE